MISNLAALFICFLHLPQKRSQELCRDVYFGLFSVYYKVCIPSFFTLIYIVLI